MFKWFRIIWWKRLLRGKTYLCDVNLFQLINCRIKGHIKGIGWYNSYGLRPGYHCKYCGDKLE